MLFRAFYALPDSITGKDGRPVNALLGTANLILREVEEHSPRAVVLCFGPDAADYRLELFDGYHAERPEVPDDLSPQFADSADFFGAFGWTVAVSENPRRTICSAPTQAARRTAGGNVLVMTGDRDMFQCASDRIDPLRADRRPRRRGDRRRGQAALRRAARARARLHRPARRPSDGIPGAKGIGEKGRRTC